MLRRAYDVLIEQSGKPHATVALAIVAFAESSIFPIPPDVMLVPMMVAQPRKAYFYAAVCTIASVLGGIVGYAIGALLFDTLGQWLIAVYGMHDGMTEFRAMYATWGAWIILLKGVTPIPFKLVTITSGFAGFDLVTFILLSLVTRAARFYVLAGLLHRFGGPIRDFMEARLGLVTAMLAIIVVGGFVAVRYLV